MECVGIDVSLGNKTVSIIGVYKRPEGNVSREEWSRFVQRRGKNEEIILAGDFNSHNRSWNSEVTDRNGEQLWEGMEENDLYLVNGDTQTRIGEVNRRSNNLDLMFETEHIWREVDYDQIDDS
ncbi:hypothetical protein DMN91_005203 [Ooceraea biroi]|uniref:Endonuclease/exonuclease/phosphatase domain-containing protein n=1 Tax=Ooceraea biroi TaxID=2015173 RepID=A0A3L8DR58_OOCBI|nr:hypothetical protein DMN91_005203 [Ooceraea biroi]